MKIRDVIAGAVIAGAVSLSVAPVHAAVSHASKATIKAVEVNDKYAFAPTAKTVTVGTKVTWKNTTDAPHTVTGKAGWKVDKAFDPSQSTSITFKKAGTYKYFCKYHPWMKGTITVK
jgi:plastocyanin